MLIKGISEKIWVWLLLGLLFICFSVLALISESIYGYVDVYVHYFISHYAFSFPSLFLNHWGKPLFIALSAPFSHFGLIGLQFFNIIISLASARLAYLICKQLKLSFAWLSILLVCFAPIYFVMAYSGLTENLFGLVLVLTVYLFLKEKYLLAAIIISFIPFARTEGTVFIPLFACALLYKRKWMPVIFLFTGFIFYSIIGWLYYHDFFWFFTKNPYTGAQDIYGKGSLWYFAAAYQEIFGAVFTILILIGIVAFCLPLLKRKGFREALYLVIIILLPPLIYFCGHSFVWWKGIYSSVGLTRVMAGILPLSAVIGVKGLNLAGKYLYERFRIPSIIFMVLLCCMILYQPFFRYKIPLIEGPEEKVLDKVASWITKNNPDKQKIFCLNQYVFFKAGINPYDTNKASVVFPPPENFTNDIHPNDILMWDSHFGYNEGHTKLNTLMQDKTLKLLAVFYPEETFKTLGDIPYEVYAFRKTSRGELFDNEMILKILNENYYQKTAIFSNNYTNSKTRSSDSLHGGCLRVTKDMEFSPGMETNLGKLNFYEKKKIEVSVDVFPDQGNAHNRIDIVSSVNDELKVQDYHRYVINFDQLESDKWNTVRFDFFLPVISDKNSVFKVYLWNTKKTDVLIDNLKVFVLECN